jgi:hypothetical protein
MVKLRDFTFIELAIIPVALEAIRKLMLLKLGSGDSYIPYKGYVDPEICRDAISHRTFATD